MDRASLWTALAGLAASLLVSVAAWVYLDSLLLFLFVPFVPFLFRGRRGDGPPGGAPADGPDSDGRRGSTAKREPSAARCPACGFRTRRPEFEYCPRDGSSLTPVAVSR